jgi:hypothetical protein
MLMNVKADYAKHLALFPKSGFEREYALGMCLLLHESHRLAAMPVHGTEKW